MARLAWVLRGKHQHAPGVAAVEKTMRAAVHDAWNDPSFLLLTAGFFVCGFRVAFIATHVPGVVALCGLPPAVGAWSLSLIGLFNIAGSFASGWAIGRWRMKSVLSLLYASRALAVLVFVFAPKTTTTFLIFAVVLGFTYLSTVPPTVGLVGKLHGTRFLATLFGIVMLWHQVGAFLQLHVDLTRDHHRVVDRIGAVHARRHAGRELDDAENRSARKRGADFFGGSVGVARIVGRDRVGGPDDAGRGPGPVRDDVLRHFVDLHDCASLAVVPGHHAPHPDGHDSSLLS